MNRYMYTNGNPILFNDPTGHDAPKWMENMNKDITNAMIESVVQQAGPELTLGYMFMEKRSRDRYEHKAGRALENPAAWFDRQVINPIQHLTTTELVVGAIVFTIALALTVATAPLGLIAGVFIGVAIVKLCSAIGRNLMGLSDSNLTKAKWNSKKADRGQKIGEDAGTTGNLIGFLMRGGDPFELKSYAWNRAMFPAELVISFDKGIYVNIGWEAIGWLGAGDYTGKAFNRNYSDKMESFTTNTRTNNISGADQEGDAGILSQERLIYYLLINADGMQVLSDFTNSIVNQELCKALKQKNCM